MSEKFVLVASFSIPYQAELARNRLQAEGVRVLMSGQIGASTFGFGVLGGQIRLEVPEAEFDKAHAILAEVLAEQEGPPPGWEKAAEQPEGLWICPMCGSAVSRARFTCPDCGTARTPDAAPATDTAIQSGAARDAVGVGAPLVDDADVEGENAAPSSVGPLRPAELRAPSVATNSLWVGWFLLLGEVGIGLGYLVLRSAVWIVPLAAVTVVAFLHLLRVAYAQEEFDRRGSGRGSSAMHLLMMVLGLAFVLLCCMASSLG